MSATSTSLLERDQVLAAVAALLDRAAAGEGGALFVSGEAGTGKTSVLEEAQRLAGERFATGMGRGDVVEAGLPFGVVDQAVRAIDGGGFEPPASGGRDARAARFYESVRWLEETSRRRPLLLLLDDVHWADPDTLALGVVVCRRIGRLPVAVIGALRLHPPGALETVLGLVAEGAARLERLEPLTPQGSAELLRRRLHHEVGEDLAGRAYEVTAGNPLLLGEVARSVDETSATHGAPLDLPQGRRLILARLVGGTPEELAFARAAAVLGRRFDPGAAAELAGLDQRAGDDALEALCRNGLVGGAQGGHAEFVHALFRQALYDDVEAPVRTRMHARAFAILHARGHPAVECADQAVSGHLSGDPVALGVLESAGITALRAGAVSSAARLLRSARELGAERMTHDARVALAEAVMLDGDEAGSMAVCQELLDDPASTPADRARALAMMGRTRFRGGSYGESARRYEAAAALAESCDRFLAVETLLEFASVALLSAGPAAALPLTTRARELAAPGPPEARGFADTAWGFCQVITGHPEGLPVAAAGSRVVEERAMTGRGPSLAWHAIAASFLEQHDEADATFLVAERWAEPGDPVIYALIGVSHAEHLARTGHIPEAIALAERAATMAGLMSMAHPVVGAIRADVLWLAGRTEESAAAWHDAAGSAAARQERLALAWLALTRLRRLRAAGDMDAACEAVAELRRVDEELGVGEPCAVPWAREACAALLAAGRDGEGADLVALLEARSARLPCRWPRIAVLGARAGLAERRGDVEEAARLHAEAVALHEGLRLPVERCRTLLDQGSFLRRRGDVTAARAVLAEALRDAEALGAVPVARAAQAELSLAGGRRRRAADDSLTAAELRVARLAAQGATNAQIASSLFVSPKTVDTHLQHVFAKLGINSRRELIRRAAELEGSGEHGEDA